MLSIRFFFSLVGTNSTYSGICHTQQTIMSFYQIDSFQFHHPFQEKTSNGLYLNNHYIPEELIVLILSYLKPNQLLHLTLVCKRWCNIIKSDRFWMYLYNINNQKKAKHLPWYVYYSYFVTDNFHNLLKNTSGERRFEYWKIIHNYGDKFSIESIPVGSDPLPCDIRDFNQRTSCFVTSGVNNYKVQVKFFAIIKFIEIRNSLNLDENTGLNVHKQIIVMFGKKQTSLIMITQLSSFLL